MHSDYGLFINGQWQPASSNETMPVIDPATEEVLGHIPVATAANLDDALDAARAAAPVWAATSGWERSEILRRIAHELRQRHEHIARLMSLETGKPIAEARGETNTAIEQFDWYADEARRIYGHTLDGREAQVKLQVRYQPVGPVAAFTAWNFPALLPARKIAPALAAGCPIIVKPSEETPSGVFLIAEAAQAAGLPAGVLNVLTGHSAMISAHLIASPVIRKVSLTGSVPVGKHILKLCADGLKKASLELGGHAPVLVFDDVDAAAVGKLCAQFKFRNAGQVCASPSRFFVHETVHEAFTAAMLKTASQLKLGRGTDETTTMGPMVNQRGRERIAELVDDAVQKGATLRLGGKIPAHLPRGFFFEPTVLTNVRDDARIMCEEPFGPIAPITTFHDSDDVIARANAVPFGLAGYVFTRSLETAVRTSEALDVGMVGVNDLMIAATEIPFGGIKDSGMGREGGKLGIFEYLEPRYTRLRLA